MRYNTTFTKDENARYSRQIRLAEIGKEGLIKLKASSVLVVGAGIGMPGTSTSEKTGIVTRMWMNQ